MPSQVPPPAQASRLDVRSLVAAGLCVLALFFDVLGWIFAIAGIFMLRRADFSRSVKWLLAAVAIAPKILFVGVQSLNTPEGLSFPIEPRNLATSSSLWAWSVLLVAFGIFLIFLPRRLPQAPNAPVAPRPARSLLISALGLVPVAAGVGMLLGVTESFHRIDDAGQGRWALRHAARGAVAVFSGSELASIEAAEKRGSRSGRYCSIRVLLSDGRSFSLTTKSAAALDQLRKFAVTAGLPPDRVRILHRNGRRWINGASGLHLKDCVGIYELTDERARSHATMEFWLDGQRLAGRETVTGPGGRHVRVLRNIKVSDSGEAEFQPANYVEASRTEKGTLSFSLRWSTDGETARFVKNGLEVGAQKYRKR